MRPGEIQHEFPWSPGNFLGLQREVEPNLPPGNGPDCAVAPCPCRVPSVSQSWLARDEAVPVPECLCLCLSCFATSKRLSCSSWSPARRGSRSLLLGKHLSEAQSGAAQSHSAVAVMCHCWETEELRGNRPSGPRNVLLLGFGSEVLPEHTDVLARWRAALLSPGSHFAEATAPCCCCCELCRKGKEPRGPGTRTLSLAQETLEERGRQDKIVAEGRSHSNAIVEPSTAPATGGDCPTLLCAAAP